MSLFDNIFGSAKDIAGTTATEFPGGLMCLNTEQAVTLRSTLEIHRCAALFFWNYSSSSCLEAIEHIKRWLTSYGIQAPAVIGVHVPVFGFEYEPENVVAALHRFGLSFPVVLDSERKISASYSVDHPQFVLIDSDGKIRFVSEISRFRAIEDAWRALITELHPEETLPAPVEPDEKKLVCYPTSPEIPAGMAQEYIGNRVPVTEESTVDFVDTAFHEPHKMYLNGTWHISQESFEYRGSGEGHAVLTFNASEVQMVLSKTDVPVTATIELNGAPIGGELAGSDITVTANGETTLTVNEPRLYSVIQSQNHLMQQELKITVKEPGLVYYACSYKGICE